MKIGRNDSCPCGSGKKYKKCCINKNIVPSKQVNIPGLWVDEMYPKERYYSSMDEYYDEVRTTGRVPHVICENIDDDEEIGHMHSIEVVELCRHGLPSSESVTFDKIDDDQWEHVCSSSGMISACPLCLMLKEGNEAVCPICGDLFPDFSEEQIIKIHNQAIPPFEIVCPKCERGLIVIDKILEPLKCECSYCSKELTVRECNYVVSKGVTSHFCSGNCSLASELEAQILENMGDYENEHHMDVHDILVHLSISNESTDEDLSNAIETIKEIGNPEVQKVLLDEKELIEIYFS
jgi:hypothetical protein